MKSHEKNYEKPKETKSNQEKPGGKLGENQEETKKTRRNHERIKEIP